MCQMPAADRLADFKTIDNLNTRIGMKLARLRRENGNCAALERRGPNNVHFGDEDLG